MNITEKEKSLIMMIARNEYNSANYGVPTDISETNTWCDCIDTGFVYDHMEKLSSTSIPGVMASLVKKGFADSNGETCCLEEKGLEYYLNEIHDPKLES